MIIFRAKEFSFGGEGFLGGFQPPSEWTTLKTNPIPGVQILPIDQIKLSLDRTGREEIENIFVVGPEKKGIGYNVSTKTYYMMASGRRIIDVMNTIKRLATGESSKEAYTIRSKSPK